MAKDYFQDITPPNPEPSAASSPTPEKSSERSIRNIAVPIRSRQGSSGGPGSFGDGVVAHPEVPRFNENDFEKPAGRAKRLWVWLVAGLSVVGLAGVLAFTLLADTRISVVPRSHTITLDPATSFKATPAGGTGESAITYTVSSSSFEDSAVVPSKGTERVEEKATGIITVYNTYSANPVRLIKNTRFEAPNGLVFRTPESVMVPGKKGTAAGQVSITVFADSAGETYNIGPVEKFTIPGLKSSPDMYGGVWASSAEKFTGGFSGDRPAVAPGALEAARSEIRARLEQKARAAIVAPGADTFVFSDLAKVEYLSLPNTAEAGGSVRIHEKAIVSFPVFETSLVRALASAVSADAGESDVALTFDGAITAKPGDDFLVNLGKSAISFALSGTARLTWNVDTIALATALAGRDQGAFQTVIGGFPAIQKAEAKIAPFWKNTFPSDAATILVEVQNPANAQ